MMTAARKTAKPGRWQGPVGASRGVSCLRRASMGLFHKLTEAGLLYHALLSSLW